MMTLVMSHFNFLASKYFVRPAASLLEKLSIFINFDRLISLLPTLSLEPMDGFLQTNVVSYLADYQMCDTFW